MSLTYKIEFQFDGREWTDVTPDVARAEWRFGQLQPNQVGTVMRPADGVISLHNDTGRYTAYNPDKDVDPTPGVPVRIRVGGLPMFSGWSEGFHTIAPVTEDYRTEVPIVGPLYRYNTYSRNIYRIVQNTPTVGELLEMALDEVGFPPERAEITASRTRLYDFRANNASLLGATNRPASLIDVCKTLAQAELGRIYDDYRGFIIFEGRQLRGPQYARLPDFRITLLDDMSIQRMAMTNISDAIINSAKSQIDNYRSGGRQDVALQGLPSESFEVAANFTTNQTYKFDTSANIAFVQSWEPIQQNVHYEYKELDGSDVFAADQQVFLIPGGDSVTISFLNNTDNERTGKVLKLEGDVWQQTNTREVNIRSEKSITKYGLKEVTIPLNLIVVTDREDIKRHLEWVVNTHDGFTDLAPSVDPMRQITLTYKINDDKDKYLRPTISDIVQLTAPRLGITHDNPSSFWVDAVDFSIDNQGSLMIKLGLTDARYTSIWPIDGMSFARNTKPGF